MAAILEKLNKPALVLCANKTLAAQLARELRFYLPNNRVEYFVSYYAYYRPEAFMPSQDTYIEKQSTIDKTLDALRHRATASLLDRRDVVVVSSVSCLYGLGMPDSYLNARLHLCVGDEVNAQDLLAKLNHIQYEDRSGLTQRKPLEQGQYEVNERRLRIWPPHEDTPLNIELSDDGFVKSVTTIPQDDDSTGEERAAAVIYPARHFVTQPEQLQAACEAIRQEMETQRRHFEKMFRFDVADRLEKRVSEDIERLRLDGFCPGMENYSRHLAGRKPGDAPATLVDYMAHAGEMRGGIEAAEQQQPTTPPNPRDWLLIVDESHVTVPQVGTMFAADRSRKHTLIEHGYRLPSALDNRPLRASEFWQRVPQTLYVSATPGDGEVARCKDAAVRLKRSGGPAAPFVDMVIRPTGVLDPIVDVVPKEGKYLETHLFETIRSRAAMGQRSLVTTLTQRDSEDLSELLKSRSINAEFLHCKKTAVERADVLSKLQNGEIDVVVGVNLLREGLDLPEVSFVGILDADKQGFLRSYRSLIQTVGRAARHIDGRAALYANKITPAMAEVLKETERRRKLQMAYNTRFGVIPRSTRNVGSSDSLFELRKEELERVAEMKRRMRGEDAEPYYQPGDVSSDSAQNNVVAISFDEETAGEHETTAPLDSPDAMTPEDRRRIAALRLAVTRLPQDAGVYTWRAEDGTVLYVGKANNLRSRCASYLRAAVRKDHHSLSAYERKTKAMMSHAVSLDHHVCPEGPAQALLTEWRMVEQLQPMYNVRLKDNKGAYPYIAVSTSDDLPQVFVSYRPSSSGRQAVFGPYMDYGAAKRLVSTINQVYQLRTTLFAHRYGDTQDLVSYRRDRIDGGAMLVLQGNVAQAAEQLRLRGEIEAALQLEDDLAKVDMPTDDKLTPLGDVDIVAAKRAENGTAAIQIMQLRRGAVIGRLVHFVTSNGNDVDVDLPEAMRLVVESHYLRNGAAVPSAIVTAGYAVADAEELEMSLASKNDDGEGDDVQRPFRLIALTNEDLGEDEDMQAAAAMAVRNLEGVVEDRARSEERAHKALEDLRRVLKAGSRSIRRIEALDISHTGGSGTVGSCVTFVDGQPMPSYHRTFSLGDAPGGDDYLALKESVSRRLARRSGARNALPDVLLVDGGRGQLSAVLEEVDRAGLGEEIIVLALAKRMEEVFMRDDDSGEVSLVAGGSDADLNRPALLLLRHLRDEAHGYANSRHRRVRTKDMFGGLATATSAKQRKQKL